MTRRAKQAITFHAALVGVSTTSSAIGERKQQAAEQSIADAGKREEGAQRTRLVTLMEQLVKQTDALNEGRSDTLRELQEVAVELGVAVAAHIVKKQIDADEFHLGETVLAAIHQLLPVKKLTVEVNPSDLGDVQQLIGGQPDSLAETISVIPNANLPPGGCYVIGDQHGLFSTLEARFENVRDTLLQGIGYARIEQRKDVGVTESLQRLPDRRSAT